MPIFTWKRLATAVLFAVAMVLLMAGLSGFGYEFLVGGGVVLVLVVGLVVIAVYRRIGYSIHQMAEHQLALLAARQKTDVIAGRITRIEETLRQAAVGELRPLVLGAFRDISRQMGCITDRVEDRHIDLAERLRKLEALLVSVEGSTKAAGFALDRQRILQGETNEKLDVGHGILGDQIDTLEGSLVESISEGRSQGFKEVLESLERMARSLKLTARKEELEGLSETFVRQFDTVMHRVDEFDGRSDSRLAEQTLAIDNVLGSLKELALLIGAAPRKEELEDLSKAFVQQFGNLMHRLDEFDGRSDSKSAEQTLAIDNVLGSLKELALLIGAAPRKEELEELSKAFVQRSGNLMHRLDEFDGRSDSKFSAQWRALEKEVVAPINQLNREIGGSRLRFDIINDMWAMESVRRSAPPSTVAPVMTGWSLEPSSLARLLRLVIERKPRLIVECGSGASTVWLGYTARQVGAKVIALEHLPKYVKSTTEEIERHGLADCVEVRLAPLEKFEIRGEEFNWYSSDAWTGLGSIDLLLVDGPPKATGHHARYPAVPLLQASFAVGTLVVLDDVHREEELEVLIRWRKEFPSITTEQPIGPRTIAVEWQAAISS